MTYKTGSQNRFWLLPIFEIVHSGQSGTFSLKQTMEKPKQGGTGSLQTTSTTGVNHHGSWFSSHYTDGKITETLSRNRTVCSWIPDIHSHRVCVCVCELLSLVWLFVIPKTVARQASLAMEFSRQEYWSGLPFPSPGDISNPAIDSGSPALQVDSLLSEPPGKTQEFLTT